MKKQSKIRLPLTDSARAGLKQHKIRIADIPEFAAEEVEVIINTSLQRAKELHALAEFQTLPSIGIRFAEDLVFMGIYSLEELRNKDGASLTNEFERKKGFSIDPCVEDQFRLAVHFARSKDRNKN
jgi:hypothetical protein